MCLSSGACVGLQLQPDSADLASGSPGVTIGLRLDCDGTSTRTSTDVGGAYPSLVAYMNGVPIGTPLPIPLGAVESGLCWIVELRSRGGAGEDRARGSVRIEGLPDPELGRNDNARCRAAVRAHPMPSSWHPSVLHEVRTMRTLSR